MKSEYSVTAQSTVCRGIGSGLKMSGLMIRDGIWVSNSQRVENSCSAWNVGQGKDEDMKNHFIICKLPMLIVYKSSMLAYLNTQNQC